MKKALSLLLVLAMVLSMVPAVFAEEATAETESTEILTIDSLDGIEVAAGETVEYNYVPAATCSLDLKTVGDAAVYVDGTLILGDVIDIELEDNVEGDIDVNDAYGDESSDNVFTAGTTYAIKIVGQKTATTLSVVNADIQGDSDDWAIDIYPMNFTMNEAGSSGTYTVSVPANSTYYYCVWYCGGMELAIGNGEAVALAGMSYAFSITNSGAEAADYVLTVSHPVGSMNNPAVLVEGSNVSTHAAGSQGYYYTYTAPAEGTLSLTFFANSETGWTYVVNNMTTYAYGETQWSDSDPVVNPAEIAVSAGDVIEVMVNTYDAEDPYNAPAGEMEIVASFSYPLGSKDNPIQLYPMQFPYTATVPANTTYYYVLCNANGMELTVGDNDPIIVAQNSVAGYTFTITNDGTEEASYAMTLVTPVGSQDNPAELVIGENTATVSEGAQGYFYTYTAAEDGTLSITMPAGNWTYAINNVTAGTYGDTQWSDSDPVVNPGTVEVAAGDQIMIMVNTYDPSTWVTPAGTLTITAAFEAAEPEIPEDANLVFYGGIALSFQDYIGIQRMVKTSVTTGYDRVYVEAIQADPSGDVVETLELSTLSSKYLMVDKQILSWSMAEEVTMTLYGVKDGVTYKGESFVTSVEDKAMEMIINYQTSNTVLCRVLVDMLNYGAEVQKAYSHNADLLPNTQLGDYSSLGTSETPTLNSTNTTSGSGTVKVYANAISMQSKVEMQLMFKIKDITDMGYELRYTVGDTTYTIAVEDFTVMSSTYTVARVPVKAANMREIHNIALYDTTTDEPVSIVYSNTVEAFAQGQMGTNNEACFIALMKYGDSVYEYANQ